MTTGRDAFLLRLVLFRRLRLVGEVAALQQLGQTVGRHLTPQCHGRASRWGIPPRRLAVASVTRGVAFGAKRALHPGNMHPRCLQGFGRETLAAMSDELAAAVACGAGFRGEQAVAHEAMLPCMARYGNSAVQPSIDQVLRRLWMEAGAQNVVREIHTVGRAVGGLGWELTVLKK